MAYKLYIFLNTVAYCKNEGKNQPTGPIKKRGVTLIRHLLLTGLPGVGKTTIMTQLSHALANYHPDGFFTLEIREDGIRKGFELVTFDGRLQLLSHVTLPGPFRVGRYGVDVAGFEKLLGTIDLRFSPSRVVMLDEIGKMECLSQRFIQEVEALLDSSKMVIATVALKGGGFPAKVKNRPDCQVVNVTLQNRSTLAGTLIPEISTMLSSHKKGPDAASS
jgi:nucleoside-triphosphatase